MAEYVRRRRPPASHPYWARLHDRAHPPALAVPIAVPAGMGLLLGLYGGLKPSFTMSEAVRMAATVSGAMAGVTFVTSLPLLLYDASRQVPRRERWAASAIGAFAVAAVLFMVGMVGLFLALAWYSACSGQGPWLGMLTGGLLGGVPAALVATGARRRWRERQKRWPRWERMRSPRPRATLTVTPIPTPSTQPPAPAANDPVPAPGHGSPAGD